MAAAEPLLAKAGSTPASGRLRPELWPISLVVLAGGLARLLTAGVQSYWYNEADTVFLIKHGFGSMLNLIPKIEGNPPVYYILTWVWSRVFGTGEVALRSLSALAGTAVIVVAYSVAKRMTGSRTAIIAAVLTAANPLLFWFSQEARPYIFLVLFVALGFQFFLRALESVSPTSLLPWVLISVLALATHYFALFAVTPELCWLLWRARWRREVIAGGAVVAAAGAALLPLAISQRNKGEVATSIVGSFPRRLVELPKQLLVGYSGPAKTLVSVLAAALAAYSVYLLLTRGDRARQRMALVSAGIGLGGFAIVLLLAAAGLDYINTRNLIALALFAILVMALGFGAPATGWRGAVAASCLSALLIADVIGVETNVIYQRDDWRGAIRALGPAAAPRVIVVTPGQGYYPMLYYRPTAKLLGGSAAVNEVDLLGIAIRKRSGVAPSPPPLPPGPPAAGFGVVAAVKSRDFTVLRYRSAAPLGQSASVLREKALSPGSRLVFIDTPARAK